MVLNYIVLTGGIKPLQNEDALLLEVVCQGLFGPSLHADELVLDFVVCCFVAFKCHLGED